MFDIQKEAKRFLYFPFKKLLFVCIKASMVKRRVHPNYMETGNLTGNLTCKTLGMFRDQAGV